MAIKTAKTQWRDVVLVCKKCSKKIKRGGFGPELNGIIGRPAGTTPDYQYSDAMKNSGVVWTREKLAAYIEAPKKVVSGTRMIFWGISDQEKIDNILAYLETFQPK